MYFRLPCHFILYLARNVSLHLLCHFALHNARKASLHFVLILPRFKSCRATDDVQFYKRFRLHFTADNVSVPCIGLNTGLQLFPCGL